MGISGAKPVKQYRWDSKSKKWKKRDVVENYQYMGSQTVGDYTYYGFKRLASTNWYIMRKDNTDNSAWAYAYSSSGGNDWATAWATPAGESYDDPPDS